MEIKYSFEQWCLDNNRQDYLSLWDYELNGCMASGVSYGSGGKYYFKCEKGIHDSELYSINKITTRNKKPCCRMCSSFGSYLLDNGELDVWSKNNKTDVFSVKKGSDTKHLLICKDCKREKMIAPTTYIHHGIGCSCGDGNSYPNKFMLEFITQLGVEFEIEKSFKWSKNRRYDAYISSKNCIIENHGIQHYEKSRRGRSLKEEQENDKLKRELAFENGIKHYIELDCRYSELDWIKNSVMNSELPQLLNFKEDDIDWIKCGKLAESNIVLKACELYKELHDTIKVANELKINRRTVTEYIKRGEHLGFVDYDPKMAMIENGKKRTGENNGNSKKVCCEGIIFDTIRECAKHYNIPNATIGNYIRGDRKMPEKFKNMELSFVWTRIHRKFND